MIQLMKRKIYPENLETLFEVENFTDEILKEHFTIGDGQWHTEDGWLIGENRECSDCMIMTNRDFTGDVLIEFDAATVLPATHDINVTWHGSWNQRMHRNTGYVFGLEGFWEGYIGFERSPDYKMLATTDLLDFKPGEVYHIAVGNFDYNCFLVVNGRLAMMIRDPAPTFDINEFGKVGFEAFCTKVKYKNLKIKRLEIVPDPKTYTPEF